MVSLDLKILTSLYIRLPARFLNSIDTALQQHCYQLKAKIHPFIIFLSFSFDCRTLRSGKLWAKNYILKPPWILKTPLTHPRHVTPRKLMKPSPDLHLIWFKRRSALTSNPRTPRFRHWHNYWMNWLKTTRLKLPRRRVPVLIIRKLNPRSVGNLEPLVPCQKQQLEVRKSRLTAFFWLIFQCLRNFSKYFNFRTSGQFAKRSDQQKYSCLIFLRAKYN